MGYALRDYTCCFKPNTQIISPCPYMRIHVMCSVCGMYMYLGCVVCVLIGKLVTRAQKVAHYLLNKLGGGRAVAPGDRVALVFRPDEAVLFATAFYGCLFSAVVPVAIEPPVTKDVSHK